MRKRITIGMLLSVCLGVAVFVLPSLFTGEPKYHGKHVSAWFKQYYRTGLKSRRTDDVRHEHAARALRALGTNAVSYLVREFFAANQESQLQTNLHESLASLPGFPPFVPAQGVCEEAGWILVDIKPPARLILPLVTNHLYATDQLERNKAVWLLGCVGEGGALSLPHLREKLRTATNHELILTTLSVERLGPVAGALIPNLTEFIRTNDSPAIYYAYRALARIGPAASNAIPLLRQRLAGETNALKQTRLNVVLLCIERPPTEALSWLQAVFAERSKTNEREQIVAALRDLGEPARPALPVLLSALEQNEPMTWHPALSALLDLGETNLAIAGALEKLKQGDSSSRLNAASFLLNLQPTNALAGSNLVQLLQDPMWCVPAMATMGGLGSAAQPLIPTLRAMATSKTNAYRYAAKQTLADIEFLIDEERKWGPP